MAEEDISQGFSLKNTENINTYLIREIDQNELMSKKHQKVCRTLNYIEHFLILAAMVTGCVSTSVFASLVGIPGGIASSAVGINVSAITAVIKNYKSMIKKKRKTQENSIVSKK